MILNEIINLIEEKFPKNLAYPWDNIGLLAGNRGMEINKILLTLDITPNVVDEAINMGAELIISHHPLIFEGIKSFEEGTSKTDMYVKLIRNNIAVYSAHTNMDLAESGINQKLSEIFGLKNSAPLEDETGLGRVGDIEKTTLFEFANKVKKTLNTENVRVSGDADKEISKVAIGSGACSDLYPVAIQKGADVLITADLKYHTAIDAYFDGIAIIDAGHYPTEIIAMDIFSELLKDTGLKIEKSKNSDIFKFI